MLLYAMFLQLEGWNLKQIVFWIFLVVVLFHAYPYSHESEQIQDNNNQIFFQKGKYET